MATQKQQQDFQDFKDNIQALRTRITEIGSKFLNDNCKVIFDKYPALVSISWVAYTPYFNDGDTCYYHSRHNYPNLEGDLENHSEIETEVKTFLSQFDDALMFELFGDHAFITITREGTTIEEYEHD